MKRVPALLATGAALLASPGCFLFDLFNQPIEIPLDLTSPEQEFDVDGPVAEAESSACVTPSAPSCATLIAICETGANPAGCAAAPTMPPEFPNEIDVNGNPVTADQAMAEMGMDEATKFEVALPVDVGGQLKDEGVDNTDAIQDVTIDNVVMLWPTNSLTFDTPPTDLYIANEAIDDPSAIDAQELIDSGAVEKIGTLGIDLDGDDTFDVGQVAGSTTEVPVEFVEGGKEKFNEAVKSASFTLVAASSDPVALKAVDGDPTQVRKPAGTGKIQLKATLVYSVSAADVVNKASE
jgi:hypothetical protein